MPSRLTAVSFPGRALRAALLALCVSAAAHAAAPASDVRVLIDVSGSMKKTDPGNLRVPALKLLSELLPAEARAGVWLFDAEVTPLLPPATVDAAWKAHARQRATRIHSNGLYTNIEAALTAASADWPEAAAGETPGRHIVLLTDGVVDVAPDAAQSAASRARVLGELLPALKAKGAHIHTVALSQDVDRALLDALTTATGGWREDAPTAAALQRAFLHMFEQAAAPDTLPLKGNRFRVDASVRELSLLVFRNPTEPAPLTLTGPDGVQLSAATPGEHSRWQSEAGYDLVTVQAPAPGDWRFTGAPDPDNRALVVTDLDLGLAAVPAGALPGEQLPLEARLLEQGRPIERDDFLALAHTTVAIIGADGAGDVRELALDPTRHAFRGSLEAELPPGPYELIVRAESATFERETRRRLRIHKSPIAFKAVGKSAESEDGPRIRLGIAVNPKLVDPASVGGYVLATAPDDAQRIADIPPLVGGKAIVDLPVEFGGTWRIAPKVTVNTLSGRALRVAPAPFEISVEGPSPPPALPPPVPPPPAPAFSWGKAAAIVGGGNLALGAVLGPLCFVLRRRELPTKGVSL
ncbi:MAG TPA: vWA domain-containing protein [Gammaproteobacteria bacterium]|nr:vWA domain-containing protein [Gammaproteobacteria bacterium]